jgi:hypothetical protein
MDRDVVCRGGETGRHDVIDMRTALTSRWDDETRPKARFAAHIIGDPARRALRSLA